MNHATPNARNHNGRLGVKSRHQSAAVSVGVALEGIIADSMFADLFYHERRYCSVANITVKALPFVSYVRLPL